MTDDAQALADPGRTGMPAALVAVLMRYDAASRRNAIRNWKTIGDDGQQDYGRHLRQARLGWLRQRRARKLASRLITGIE